ncbi:GNAT family N-acetyltransferase [Paenibacillus silvae]|uniref:GNAT family N-acetyltransferase n=1 Tax=Paenibacillus silvae TaxID=1325358 RepID=UPI00200442AF|nr:GNAT family N-acetyltransferase [Paenibacillus silvae]MCK6073946.1 GNAT family N-acetyltransferase [Paenibacillus silvae]MCK6148576.1 GNAT family N-acetyltransferase [Paenibacillus silvae]MCK6266878.1 GNAT family N-acetyltransferase [Paenibacillus silvae]
MIRIRQARQGDAQAIAYVHTESWKTTYRGIVPDHVLHHLTTESRLPQWEKQIRSGEKDQILLVAEERDGKIVGFACGGKEREGKLPYDGELYAIYLLQSYQQSGIGRQLVQRIVQHLQKCQMRTMLIWALERNPACRFYEKLRGIPVHTQQIRIGDEDVAEVAYGWSDLNVCLTSNEVNE